ncbi:MAG: helix-turn-helix transcriptional regulator [Planctomycetota bacterium]|jgi:transcriptional regulator with XRE-family HTH domain|nr:helix-turn-helix transcriptional regulator [Planctomycetota bacterium]
MNEHEPSKTNRARLRRGRLRKGCEGYLGRWHRLSGIDRARLSRLESNPHANPTIETLARIAVALGVELRVAVVGAE